MWFLQVAQGIPQGRRQSAWATRPLGRSCSFCPLGHNSTWCFIGKSGLLWSRRDCTSLAEVSPQSGHVRAEGSLKALRSAPARPLQAFPSPCSPQPLPLLVVPQGLLQEHKTASRPRFPPSFSPFPCNSLIPRYVWSESVASLNKHQNRRRPCSDTDCESVPRVPDPQGLSHRST